MDDWKTGSDPGTVGGGKGRGQVGGEGTGGGFLGAVSRSSWFSLQVTGAIYLLNTGTLDFRHTGSKLNVKVHYVSRQ